MLAELLGWYDFSACACVGFPEAATAMTLLLQDVDEHGTVDVGNVNIVDIVCEFCRPPVTAADA